MQFRITEKLDFQDFMEANFPKILRPFYTKRMFIINFAFAVLFLFASIYIFTQSIKNGIELNMYHYGYAFFAVLFSFLAVFLISKEKKAYRAILDEINDLQTTYEFSDNGIKVVNNKTTLNYHRNEIANIEELDKWFVIDFKNRERLSVYKPNLGKYETDFRKLFAKYLNRT